MLRQMADCLCIHVIGHQDRRLGLCKLLCGPEGVGVVPVRVARQGDEPAAIGNENGWSVLLPVSIEVVVVVGRGISGEVDVQPFSKLGQLHERRAGTDRSRCR
jgi:hypothetical protein